MFSKSQQQNEFSPTSIYTLTGSGLSTQLQFSTISRFAEDLSRRFNKLKQLRKEKDESERSLINEQFKPTEMSDRLVYKQFAKDFNAVVEMRVPVVK